jgi:large conductance mechanosensitive channel
MPPLGLLTGGVDFTQLFVSLDGNSYATLADAQAAKAATLNYGIFIQTVVDFVIVAFAIFLMVKWINSLKKKEEAAPQPPPPMPTKEEILLTEIRDLLANGPAVKPATPV